METIIRQAAGIDCGSQELVVSLSLLSSTGSYGCKGTKAFANTLKGFKQLQQWAHGLSAIDTLLLYVMEATGVYHEKLAYFLVAEGCAVSIVLPNKVNAFAKTCASKKQDDSQASRVLAEFGCVKQLDHWQPPHPVFAGLKQLTIRNSRQLVSYAGLDVTQKQSGTSVSRRAHISKRGNVHLRHCLYFPALSAVRHNSAIQPFYERIVDKGGIKMKGYVAVQRKLLVLIYTIWNSNEEYHSPIKHSEQPKEAALTELDSIRS